MIDLPFNSSEFAEKWTEWLLHKKENHKFEYKPMGLKSALNKIKRYSHGSSEIAIAVIDNAIAENWKGFHPLQYNDPLMIKQRNEQKQQNKGKQVNYSDDFKREIFKRLQS